MKFNCNNDQIKIVDSNTDVIHCIREITKNESPEEPFYIFDVQDVIQKYNIWKKKLPRVIPYYSVKCNDNLFLLKMLSSFGFGFDCNSKGEIKKILSLGVEPSRITYSQPVKPSYHIKYAADEGIELTTFDNADELFKIKKMHQSAKLLIRFQCDKVVSQCPWVSNLGCNSITEASDLLRLARKLNLEIVGVCFQVNSSCSEPEAIRRGIAMTYKIFELGRSMDFKMRILDIGGGFPGVKGYSISTLACTINQALKKYFPEDNNLNIRAEFGRYLVTSAFTLVTLIYGKQVILDPLTNLPHTMYFVNDGIYGSFNSLIYDHAKIQPLTLTNMQSREIVSASIWGQTCDPADRLVENVEFPNMEVGEWIIFENMGAHTLSSASSFNGFPVANVHCILDESTRLQLKNVF